MAITIREHKNKEISVFEVALDCCAVIYLTIFWLFDFLIPIVVVIYFIIYGFKNSSYFFIIYGIIFTLFWILYFISRGIIKRKRFFIIMGIIISIFFINIDINIIKSVSGSELIKHTAVIQSLITFIFIDIILFISLFLKRLYKK
jgi:hypothetical protein